MNDNSKPNAHYVAYDDLVGQLEGIFESNGCSRQVSALLARNCAAAERDGALSHGLFRLAGYVSTLRNGWVDGKAVPSVERSAPAFLRVDGRNGFTLSSLDAVRLDAADAARENGVAVVAIRNSHHLGALSLDVELFAEDGLFALSVINSMKSVVPFDGKTSVFGTNPIAYAAPRDNAAPLVVDLATSSMAHGDVQLALQEGRALPPNGGVDRDGRPTTDPASVLDGGALLTFGGYKGGAIAMMVELLCAAIGGGKFSHEVDLSRHPGAVTPHTGQTFVLIDPAAGRGAMTSFTARVGHLVEAIYQSGATRLPGDRRLKARAFAATYGIPLDAEKLAMLETFSAGQP